MKATFEYVEQHINRLSQALRTPPGWRAQKMMAPRIQDKEAHPLASLSELKRSAVLVLLVPGEQDIELVYTLRTSQLNAHGGQISFPGGRCDGNETFEQAALRETREEIGLDTSPLQLIGSLSQLPIPHSNNLVQPIVAWCPEPVKCIPNPSEVEEVFQVPVHVLLDSTRRKEEVWRLRGQEYIVPFWDIHPKTPLWGATAIITSELLDVYRSTL